MNRITDSTSLVLAALFLSVPAALIFWLGLQFA